MIKRERDVLTSQDVITNLDSIIAHLPGHVYWVDNDGRFLGCNTRQALSYGYASIDDVIGKTLPELGRAMHADIITTANERVMRSGIAQTIEEPFIYPDGTRATFLSKKVPLRDDKGEITGILGISFDITDQKRSARQKISLLENIIALMPGHVYWKDTQGQFMGCNDAQAETAGFKREEMVGKIDADMPWADQAAYLRENDQAVIQADKEITVEEESKLPNGDTAIFLSKKTPLKDDEERTVGVLGVSFDITDRKRARRLELANQMAAEKSDTMKLMAASIAHELRTPLTAVHSAMSWVKVELPKIVHGYEAALKSGLDVEEIHPRRMKLLKDICPDIMAETESANNIINMLLVKLDQTTVNHDDLIPCSIGDCIREALNRYPFSSDVQRELIHWDESKDFSFMGVNVLMTHILFNLIKNALYFIEQARKGDIQVWIEEGKLENKLHFKDTGKGVSSEVAPSIFERFFSKTQHGAGIGLAFCKQAMHSFGGTIECYSKEGLYTEFVMRFPVMKREKKCH